MTHWAHILSIPFGNACGQFEMIKTHKRPCMQLSLPFYLLQKQAATATINEKINIEEIEYAKKHENYYTRPVSGPLRAPQNTEKYANTTGNEHRRSRRARNYENSKTKPRPDHRGHPKTT